MYGKVCKRRKKGFLWFFPAQNDSQRQPNGSALFVIAAFVCLQLSNEIIEQENEVSIELCCFALTEANIRTDLSLIVVFLGFPHHYKPI